MTFQHYYLKAVSKCMFFGTPGDVTYCHQLANLCVLQLYDTNSQACADHLTIVNARSTSYVNDLTNWVTGMPWLYFGGDDAHSVCTTFNYKKRMTLSGAVVNYVLAGFYMNGTFAGERQCCGFALSLMFRTDSARHRIGYCVPICNISSSHDHLNSFARPHFRLSTAEHATLLLQPQGSLHRAR
jgi:hypothetical protein